MSEDAGPAPLLRVVSGHPTAEELAALVVVVSTRGVASGPDETLPAPPAWSAPSRLVRRPLLPGPDGWRRHLLPH
ncbi:MAG: acyl-CoA carboxylase subunit epsilon [Nocardioidaceae bacterium]